MHSIVLDALKGSSEEALEREEIAFLQVGSYQGTNVAFAFSSGKDGVVFLCFFSFMVGFFQLCGSYKYRVSITVKDCKLKCSNFFKSTAKQIFSLLHVKQKLFGTWLFSYQPNAGMNNNN